jgi:hypothetical protein
MDHIPFERDSKWWKRPDVLVKKIEVVALIVFGNGSTNILHKQLVSLVDALNHWMEALEFEKRVLQTKAEREDVHIL